ncbi:MAG: TonB family protein [Gammaproteobacteria bacterium]|nr:TonB family protein [Gammaproteobacteria bacterium]
MLKQFYFALRSFTKNVIILLTMGGAIAAMAAQTARLADGSDLELKGIGKATEFRTEIYIGLIYAPVGLDSIELIKEFNTPKRLTVRYVADNYSYRKVSRHFKERIALNNPRDVWQPMTSEIVRFSRIFKENFIAGDEIRMDFIPGKGTSIYLNDVLFETIEKPAFINLVINAWTGSVPPSKSFKQGITGALSDSEQQKLIAEFSALSPQKGRFKLDLGEQIAEAKPETKPTPAANKPEPKKEPPKQVTQKPKPKPAEVKKQVVQKAKPEPKKEPPKQVAEQPKPQPQPIPEEDLIDEDLIRGSYVRDLIDAVRGKLEYPRKAFLNGEEGDALAIVTIDRDGEIQDVKLEERTGSRELDKAVIKVIRRAQPFPKVPKELKQETFTFEVPISFEL